MKYDFILSSISDIQSAIRAIDNKLIALLVLLMLPITKLDVLIAVFAKIIDWSVFYGYSILLIFVTVWLLGFISTLLGILSIENPSKHIKNADSVDGLFYGGKRFQIKKKQVLFSKKISSKEELSSIIKSFNISNESIFEELVFEQTKLIFIRDLKIKRQKIAIGSIAISVLIFLTNWTIILTQTIIK